MKHGIESQKPIKRLLTISGKPKRLKSIVNLLNKTNSNDIIVIGIITPRNHIEKIFRSFYNHDVLTCFN